MAARRDMWQSPPVQAPHQARAGNGDEMPKGTLASIKRQERDFSLPTTAKPHDLCDYRVYLVSEGYEYGEQATTSCRLNFLTPTSNYCHPFLTSELPKL